MNFCLTPPFFSIFFKKQNIKKWSQYYISLKILKLKKVVTLLCTFGQVKKSGHNFLKTYILKNQPQLFKIHTYFEIRKISLSKKNKKAMQTLRWTPPPPTQTNMNNLATPLPLNLLHSLWMTPNVSLRYYKLRESVKYLLFQKIVLL